MREQVTGTRLEFIQQKLARARRMLEAEPNRERYAAEVKRLENAERQLQRFDFTHVNGFRRYELRNQ